MKRIIPTPEQSARLRELEAVIENGLRNRTPRMRRGITNKDQRPHVVYVCRSISGEIVYVGISLSAAERLSSHKQAHWWSGVDSIKLHHCPNRRAAMELETGLIGLFKPLFNRAEKSIK